MAVPLRELKRTSEAHQLKNPVSFQELAAQWEAEISAYPLCS